MRCFAIVSSASGSSSEQSHPATPLPTDFGKHRCSYFGRHATTRTAESKRDARAHRAPLLDFKSLLTWPDASYQALDQACQLFDTQHFGTDPHFIGVHDDVQVPPGGPGSSEDAAAIVCTVRHKDGPPRAMLNAARRWHGNAEGCLSKSMLQCSITL